jgi:hypothetical protein
MATSSSDMDKLWRAMTKADKATLLRTMTVIGRKEFLDSIHQREEFNRLFKKISPDPIVRDILMTLVEVSRDLPREEDMDSDYKIFFTIYYFDTTWMIAHGHEIGDRIYEVSYMESVDPVDCMELLIKYLDDKDQSYLDALFTFSHSGEIIEVIPEFRGVATDYYQIANEGTERVERYRTNERGMITELTGLREDETDDEVTTLLMTLREDIVRTFDEIERIKIEEIANKDMILADIIDRAIELIRRYTLGG